MSKHKHVETAAHASNAVDASPREASVAVPLAAVEAPVAHAAVVAPDAVVAPEAASAPVAASPAAAARMATTLYGAGLVWAQKGIGLGKTALEGLARALDRGAKLLGDLQTQIKTNAEKSAA